MRDIKKISAAVTAVMLIGGMGAMALADKTDADTVSYKDTDAVSHPVDNEGYIYTIASVSKVYATVAVMQLVDEGKVELDSPVTDYIPGFTMADERYKDITVRMLMDHTSGIMGSTKKNGDLYDDNDTISYDTKLEKLSRERLKADPGKYAAYCNDGFDLLELIVENVTGMDYTEYVEQNIAARTGCTSTGTAADMFRNERLVPSVSENGLPIETEYCMTFGAGGVQATAADTACFGTGFFTGNGAILSESSKTVMAKRWDDNAFHDANGLGWDTVDTDGFKERGVKVVGKGGDVAMDHAWLAVAPDNDISIAVLTNGGMSSYCELMSEELMNVALAEQGIGIDDTARPECTIVTEIPEGYAKFAGWYIQSIMGIDDTILNVSFPENKYMHIEKTDHRKTESTDYVLTSDGGFAELAYEADGGDIDLRLAAGYNRIYFEENEDGIFTKLSADVYYPGLGVFKLNCYDGQKIEEADVSDEVIDSYKALESKALLLNSDKYSSDAYEYGYTRIKVCDELRGYVFLTGKGSRFLFRIQDADHLVAFKDIPSSSSRDIYDITLEKDEQGSTHFLLSHGQSYITDDHIPVFDTSVKTITIGDGPAWYDISDAIANTPVTVTRPEKSAVFVYNKFGEVIYNSHVKDAGNTIPMPKGGYVLFLGEQGTVFTLK